ncbi:MAG: FAD binding domain-containing protein, partial [Planctomycetota bacterium]
IKTTSEGGLVLGANVILSEAEQNPLLQEKCAVLAKTIRLISTPLLRNMGTLGGNICLDTRCNYYDQNYDWRASINFCMKKEGTICWVAQSSPTCLAVTSTDTAPVLVALGAQFQLVSHAGERRVLAKDFYQNDGIYYLKKQADEILTAIHLPPQEKNQVATYWKLRRRGAFDFPVLGVAVNLKKNKQNICEDLQLVIGGIASAPIQIQKVQEFLCGKPLVEENLREVSRIAWNQIRPMNNTDFEPIWRKEISQTYIFRALKEVSETSS